MMINLEEVKNGFLSTDIVYFNYLLLKINIEAKILAADNLIFWSVLWVHFIAWGSFCALNAVTF